MDREEFESQHGPLIERLISAKESGYDPTRDPEWDKLVSALEDDADFLDDADPEIEFQVFRLDSLGGERLNDDVLREELGMDEEDEIGDDDRVEFIRDVLHEAIGEVEGSDSDIHPTCRAIPLSAPDGREILVGYAASAEGFAGEGLEFFGLFHDEEEFREDLRIRHFVTDLDEIDVLGDDELLALWV